MFYTIVNELTRTRKNNTVWKEYGADFARLCRCFDKGTCDIKNKQLTSITTLAKTLDVPVDFVISILSYGKFEEEIINGTGND